MQNIIQTLLLIIFALLLSVILGVITIMTIKFIMMMGQIIINKKSNIQTKAYMQLGKVLIICLTLLAFDIQMSQLSTFTPSIKGDNAIAELQQISFNGRKQWISIRGEERDAPVLLFLAGGPGGSQLAAVRHALPELEKHFVVIGWDQPGSGKSYASGKNLKTSDYIDDGIALTEYLCDRFNTPKIYLVGESWGSALGVFLADARPELYHALINTGQMVDFLETERLDYAKALELSVLKGDTEKTTRLLEIGAPPFYGDDMVWRSAEYINYLTVEMNQNPDIQNRGYDTPRDLLSPEYGILDKFNYVRGIITTYNKIYPNLYGIDLRVRYNRLEVPISFLIGRHDLNAPTELAEAYFETLQAPYKEFIWFEHSGHSPWLNESQKFTQAILDVKARVTSTSSFAYTLPQFDL